MADRFDKFTKRARKVLTLAQEEAQRFNHNYIGTEHLLLGLLGVKDGVAAQVLTNLGIEGQRVRSSVEFMIGRGDRLILGEISLTSGAKRVIELAVDEARRLNHHYIGTEHLLLGLVREGEGVAAGVLESFGASLERVRSEVLHVLSQPDRPDEERGFRRAYRSAGSREQMDNPFDLLMGEVRRIVSDAHRAAVERGHSYLGTEHLLLGLIAHGRSPVAQTFRQVGIDSVQIRRQFTAVVGPDPDPGTEGLTAGTRLVIERALSEANRRGHAWVRAEHLLLALLTVNEGRALSILDHLGADREALRAAVERRLEDS